MIFVAPLLATMSLVAFGQSLCDLCNANAAPCFSADGCAEFDHTTQTWDSSTLYGQCNTAGGGALQCAVCFNGGCVAPTTAAPVTTAKPIETTAKPADTTARPVDTTVAPVETTARPGPVTATFVSFVAPTMNVPDVSGNVPVQAVIRFAENALPIILELLKQQEPLLDALDLSEVHIDLTPNQFIVGFPKVNIPAASIKQLAGESLSTMLNDMTGILNSVVKVILPGASIGAVDLQDVTAVVDPPFSTVWDHLVISVPGVDISVDQDTVKGAIKNAVDKYISFDGEDLGVSIDDIVSSVNAAIDDMTITSGEKHSILYVAFPEPAKVPDMLEYALEAFVYESNILQDALRLALKHQTLTLTVKPNPVNTNDNDATTAPGGTGGDGSTGGTDRPTNDDETEVTSAASALSLSAVSVALLTF